MTAAVAKTKCIIDPYISYESFIKLSTRIVEFKNNLNDPNTVPVKVFDPLAPRLVEQLLMLREMSKGLQLKKDEDIKNSQRTAEDVEKSMKKPSEEITEEKSESTDIEISENIKQVENKDQ